MKNPACDLLQAGLQVLPSAFNSATDGDLGPWATFARALQETLRQRPATEEVMKFNLPCKLAAWARVSCAPNLKLVASSRLLTLDDLFERLIVPWDNAPTSSTMPSSKKDSLNGLYFDGSRE